MSKEKQENQIDPFAMVRKIKRKGPAPVHLWDPPFCGDMDMLIARDGSWIHEGRAIKRKAMIELFASVLMRDNEGDYYLVTPVEKVRIKVEDCPFVAVAMEVEGRGAQQQLHFTTNLGESVLAGELHAIRIEIDEATDEPHPIIHVRNGLNALINRAVFYRLIELSEQHVEGNQIITGVHSGGVFFEFDRQEAD